MEGSLGILRPQAPQSYGECGRGHGPGSPSQGALHVTVESLQITAVRTNPKAPLGPQKMFRDLGCEHGLNGHKSQAVQC